jgi:hypothetical protein
MGYKKNDENGNKNENEFKSINIKNKINEGIKNVKKGLSNIMK